MSDLKKAVHVFSDAKSAGSAAGKAIETCILKLQAQQDEIRIIFAAAPSQDAMLDYLSESDKIDWQKIVAFHMDEYLGLPNRAPQLFSTYLENRLFSKVSLKQQFIINPGSKIPQEIERYSQLINAVPIDMVCLGIGENGHIAFNDPPVAKFDDSETIKEVKLDEECRIQQVNDDCFETLGDVPTTALTLTVPTLLNGKHLFCVVLGALKSNAVKEALTGPVSTDCPASILKSHPNCKFYFDEAAYQDVAEHRLGIANQ